MSNTTWIIAFALFMPIISFYGWQRIKSLREKMAVLENAVSEINSQKIRICETTFSSYSEIDLLRNIRALRAELCSHKLGDEGSYLFPEKFITKKYENEESMAVCYAFYLDTKQEDVKVYLRMKWHF